MRFYIGEIFMQKCLSILIISFLCVLSGCQSNPGGQHAPLFGNPFKGSYTSQMDLTQAVQEALMRHDELAVTPIHVETRQGIVILSGYVKKIRQSDTAEQIARQVPGVYSVENHIIVRP
jgi:hyperosmotically inducible protein